MSDGPRETFTIKPLEFRRVDPNHWVATSVFGSFCIEHRTSFALSFAGGYFREFDWHESAVAEANRLNREQLLPALEKTP